MTVGEKIRYLRKKYQLTQKELGLRVGLSDVRVRHYETGIRTPKDSRLQAFAEYFGVPIGFFRDHTIDTVNDAIYALFDLKCQYGGHIIKTLDETTHTYKYSLVFDNQELNARMGNWHDNEKLKHSVEEWEQRYPYSFDCADNS